MKFLYKAVVVLLALLTVSAFAEADVVQPNDDFYFLDTAGVLSEETEGEIFFSNRLLYDACGAQIVIAALDSIGGADTYDYACDLFNAWGIGSAEENNGFLLLMTVAEDDYYALPGSGIDGIFSASELKRLLDSELEDDFAAKNYDAGAKKFFEAVFEKIADRYNANVTIEQGIEAYNAFKAASAVGAVDTVIASSQGGGGAPTVDNDGWTADEGEDGPGLLGTIIGFIILFGLISRICGGRFFFWMPFFFNSMGYRRPSRPYGAYHNSYHGSGYHGGSSHHGGSSFRSGGFGGARGGGGRSFGGGAGRGRH